MMDTRPEPSTVTVTGTAAPGTRVLARAVSRVLAAEVRAGSGGTADGLVTGEAGADGAYAVGLVPGAWSIRVGTGAPLEVSVLPTDAPAVPLARLTTRLSEHGEAVRAASVGPDTPKMTANEAFEGRVGVSFGKSLRQVEWREIAQALNAEASVDGMPGVTRASADGGASEDARSDANPAAITRALRLAAPHGVPVYLPTERSPTTGEIIPYPWRGTLWVPDNGELIGGRLRVPDGALTSRETSGNTAEGEGTLLAFEPGTRRARIRRVEIDGGSAAEPTAYILDRATGGARIRGGFDGILAGAQGGTPFEDILIEECHIHHVWGSCITGSGSFLRVVRCTLGYAETDHLLYRPPGERHGQPDGTIVSDCVGYGSWSGAGFDMTSTVGRGILVHSIEPNGNRAGARQMGAVIAIRSYQAASDVRGVLVVGDLSVVPYLTRLSFGPHTVEIAAEHWGAADLPGGAALNLVDMVGGSSLREGGQPSRGSVSVRVANMPGGTQLFYNNRMHDLSGVTVDIRAVPHPMSTVTADGFVLYERAYGLRAHVEVPRSPRGGGLNRLFLFHPGGLASGRFDDIRMTGRVATGSSNVVAKSGGTSTVTGLDLTGLVVSKPTRAIGTTDQEVGSLLGARVLAPAPTPLRYPATGTVPWSVDITEDSVGVEVLVSHALGRAPTRYDVTLDDPGLVAISGVVAEGDDKVYITLDTASVVDLAETLPPADDPGGVVAVSGTIAFEVETTYETRESRRVDLTTVAGVTAYDVPLSLASPPVRYAVRRLDTGALLPVVGAPTASAVRVELGSATGVVALWVEASCAADDATRGLVTVAPLVTLAGSVSAGTDFAAPGNASIEFTLTPPATGNLDLWLRRVDASNYVRLRTSSDGKPVLSYLAAGVATSYGAVGSNPALAAGTRVRLVLDGTTARLYATPSGGSETLWQTWNSVSQYQTATGGGRVQSLGTSGGAVADLVVWTR